MVKSADKISVPSWACKSLTQDQLPNIAAAVMNAEVKTSAEIVPMVVRSSAVNSHVPAIIVLVYCLFALLFWPFAHAYIGNYWIVAAILLIVGFLAIQFASHPSALILLTDSDDLDKQVCQRAELEFYRAGLKRTSGRTGILLFLSLAEHEAIVLADKGISEKLPPETWKQVCDILTSAARRKDLSRGLVDAIERCGELCAPHFPPVGTNPNELEDALVIKE